MSDTADSTARPTVYVETSVISYLAANLSGDVITRARQKTTRDWWSKTARWDLIISSAVMREAILGDHHYAIKRLELLIGITVLSIDTEARRLADELLQRRVFPANARPDAEHVAVAAVNAVEFLVTWSLKHIANAIIRRRAEEVCRLCGYEPPVICTPEELLEEL